MKPRNFDVLAARSEAEISCIRDYVCPLYIYDKHGFPQLTGSGVLLSINEGMVILTAAHVVKDHGKNVFIGAQDDFLRVEHFKITNSIDNKPDNVDFAYSILPKEISNIIGKEFNAIPLSEKYFDLSWDSLPNDHVAILGYPATRNETDPRLKRVKVQRFALTTMGVPVLTYETSGFPMASHFLASFNRKESHNEIGEQYNPPELNGISGGGVWKLRDLHNPPAPDRPPELVGIVTEQNQKQRILVSTRLALIIQILRNQIPEFNSKFKEDKRYKIDFRQ